MPFATLTSDGLSIACFLAPHDWNKALSISHYFPTDLIAGLSNRESRRPEAEALLLTAAVKLRVKADEAQALRQQLATLAAGWVGLPIWGDRFLGADKAVFGARLYAPQRLIDLTAPEIVASTASLHATHTYAPLLVGHITDLPALAPIAGGAADCVFTMTEDSPWAFRIGAQIAPAAGTWPATLRPDWNSPPSEQPARALKFERIGMQREQTIAGLESAFVWKSEATFRAFDRASASTLLGFFIACRGRWQPFDAPLWFTPGTPTAEAPHATTVRFDDDVLVFDFSTTECVSAKVKLAQVPWEILGTEGEAPQQPARIYLYQFKYLLPVPIYYRFTNCWRPLTRSGDGTYAPAPMEHESISGGLTLAGEDLTLTSFMFAGNPLDMFEPSVLEAPLELRVYEIESDPIDPDSAVARWFGSVLDARPVGRKYSALDRWLAGLLDQEIPVVKGGVDCGTYFCSEICGHVESDYFQAGVFATSVGRVVTVTASDAAATNFYNGGKIEVGTGAAWESRQIVKSSPVAGGQQFTLDAEIRQAPAGQSCQYRRGCDLSKATCKLLDPSGWKARFQGEPNMSQTNLTIPDWNTGSGGKK